MYMQGRGLRPVVLAVAVVVSLIGLSSGCASGDHDDAGSASSTASDGGTKKPSASSGASARPAQASPSSTPSASPSPEDTRPLKDATAVLVSCASPQDPRATVKVSNPNTRDGSFAVKIGFLDASGFEMVKTRDPVWAAAGKTGTYRVRVTTAGVVDHIARCVVEPRAAWVGH
ncbi:hypothetical protein ACIQUP_24425 [Streptomyces nigra]|uniref:hypothetical protein n=1 Tax=Streptomyces nigra TaxID=1827580 RepID=UPI00343E929F